MRYIITPSYITKAIKMPGHDPDLNMKYASVEDMLKTILQSTDLLSESVETLKKIAT